MHVFCTYFDHHYLPRGLVLYESLRRHGPDAKLWVLCLSQEAYNWLVQERLDGVRPISLEEFEQADPELRVAKLNRTIVEYYFSCTPSLPLFVFARDPQADMVTYVDADLYFFRDPLPVIAEMAQNSIAIIGHRFPPSHRYLEKTGIYNVGWISFRRDENARRCLDWWRHQCLEWCYDRVEEGRYGDQKYLDQWSTLFRGVVVIKHQGANLAPWNLANYTIYFRDGRVWVDDQELIFFHFQGFQQINRWLYEPQLIRYGARPTRIIRQHILLPYWRALQHATAQLNQSTPDSLAPAGLRKRPKTDFQLRRWYRLVRGFLRQQYVFVRSHNNCPNLIRTSNN